MVRKIEAMKMMLLIGNRIVGNIIAYNSSWKDIGQWNSEGKKNVIFVEGRSHSRTDNHNFFYIHFWNFIFEDWISLQNIQSVLVPVHPRGSYHPPTIRDSCATWQPVTLMNLCAAHSWKQLSLSNSILSSLAANPLLSPNVNVVYGGPGVRCVCVTW